MHPVRIQCLSPAKNRLFNRIGQQPIFSILICGASGIGKTEVARLLHQKLSMNEPMIKINFGNYSAQDALNVNAQ